MENFQFLKFNFQNNPRRKKEGGFTLVEVLVTSLIFSIIALAVSSVLVQALNLQRRGTAAQKIQDNALFVFENMSRDIRVSAVSNQNSNCSASSLTINHPSKGVIDFRLNAGVIEKREAGGSFYAISGSDVSFSRFNFCVTGSVQNDNKTPRVAILATVQNATGREILKINIQTTVSSRDEIDEFSFP